MTPKQFVLSIYPKTEVEYHKNNFGKNYWWFVETDPINNRMGAFCGYSSTCEEHAWEIVKNQILTGTIEALEQ